MSDKQLILLSLSVIFCLASASSLPEERVAITTTERVHGKAFLYSCESTEQGKHESWTIDGQEVTRTVFDESILEAEKEERKAERMQRYAELQKDFERKRVAQVGLFKSELQEVVTTIEAYVQQLKEVPVQCVVYLPETMTAEQFDSLVAETLPRAKLLLKSNVLVVHELRTILEQLTTQSRALRKLVIAAVDRAIQTCDDTATLKRLMELEL